MRSIGTLSKTFFVGMGNLVGRILLSATDGEHEATLTITNDPLTIDRKVTFPDSSGKVLVMPETENSLTPALTDITHTNPQTPDFDIQDLTDTGGFGFASKDEGNTVLAVIANLQIKVRELEIKLGFLEASE